MLLAIDIGNTSIKFGIFDGDKLLSKFSIPTNRDADVKYIGAAVGKNIGQPVSDAIICSVVPELDNVFVEFLSGQFGVEPTMATNDLDFGITIKYEPLSDAGCDRLVNAFAAVKKYGPPCIVCSFGTALTIDIVDKDRVLIGGLIAPGMKLIARALHQNTSRLPEVEIKKPASVIQNTTIGSLQSGIFYGYLGLFEGLIARIKAEKGDGLKVIATGGFAPLIAENTRSIDIVDENLLLDGLRALHDQLY